MCIILLILLLNIIQINGYYQRLPQLAFSGEFKFQVGILYGEPKSNNTCGGAIIRGNFVLTSAECVCSERNLDENEIETKDMHIITRVADFSSAFRMLYKVRRIYCHPEYNGTDENNVALLQTERIDFNFYKDCVGIYDSNVLLPINKTVRVSGWGYIHPDKTGNLHLIHTRMVVTEPSTCGVTSEKFACLSIEENTVPCFTDLGGTVITKFGRNYILYGLFHGECSDSNTINITLVHFYKKWISGVINMFEHRPDL